MARRRNARPTTLVCRHGFEQPAYEVSKRFVDADGIERWGRVTRVDAEGCPDTDSVRKFA